MTDPLEATIIDMLHAYPYHAALLQQMTRIYSSSVPIAGVNVTSRINLYINRDAFASLPKDVRIGVLLHECYHILHDHIGRSKSIAKGMNKALNVAADRAINEHIHALSKNGRIIASVPDSFKCKLNGKIEDVKPVTKHNFQEQFKGKTIKNNETMDYYYKFLKENAKKGKNGENDFEGDMDLMDDHDKWDEGGSSEATKEIIKHAANKAAEKTKAGNIPGDVQSILNELNKSVVNWKHILKRFISKAIKNKIDSSRKRRNKRYGIIHPGHIKHPELTLGIAIDTSGSVADRYLQQFFSEIKKIHSIGGIDITCVEADCSVQQVFEYNPKKKITVKGRGGTAFQPAITALEKANVDAIIYLSDGESNEDLKIKKPILWGLCPSYTIPKGVKEKNCIKIKLPDEQEK